MLRANTGQCIVNMIRTRQNTHPLFRSFGLGAVVDEPMPITRSSLQVEVARWYPSVRVQEVRVTGANEKGEFNYTVRVQGR